MTIGFTSLVNGVGANALSFSTASWTPVSGRAYIVFVHARVQTGGIQPAISSFSGNGMTWNFQMSVIVDGAGTTDRANIFAYWGIADGSSTTGATSFTFSGSTNMAGVDWNVIEITGADTSGSLTLIKQTANTANTSTASPSCTFSSNFIDATNNAALVFAGSSISNNMTGAVGTAGTGMTKIAEGPASNGNFVASISEYRIGQQLTVGCTFPASGRTGILALEIAAASASTTPVSDSWQTTYNVIGQVSDSFQGLWNVIGTVSDSWQTLWTVRTPISDALQTSWNTYSTVSDNYQTSWNTIGQVSDSWQTSWGVAGPVSDSWSTSWNTLLTAYDIINFYWNVRASVSDSWATSWNTIAQILDSYQTSWNVAAQVNDSLQTLWNVLVIGGVTPVSDSWQTSWNTAAQVNDSYATSWNVIAQILDLYATSWNTAAQVSDSWQTSWKVATSVSDSWVTSWNTRAFVADSLTTSWNTLASVSDTLNVKWFTLQSASDSWATSWKVVGRVSDTLTAYWNVGFTFTWTDVPKPGSVWTNVNPASTAWTPAAGSGTVWTDVPQIVPFTPTNLLTAEQSTFETANTSWGGFFGSLQAIDCHSPDASHSGGFCCKVTWKTAGVGGNAAITNASGYIDNSWYEATAWVWVPAGATRVQMSGYFQSNEQDMVNLPRISTVFNQWQQIGVRFQHKPGDAVTIGIVSADAATVGQLCYIDDVSLVEVSSPLRDSWTDRTPSQTTWS